MIKFKIKINIVLINFISVIKDINIWALSKLITISKQKTYIFKNKYFLPKTACLPHVLLFPVTIK